MKKVKLLTSLTALVLALSICGCGSSSEEEVSKTDDSVASNVTLNFSFIQDDKAVLIEENASAYVIGSWDSWGQFLLLEENNTSYSYTFNEISVGSYQYRVMMWYKDESVSLSNSIEITDGNQRVEITKEDENSSIEISLDFDAKLPELGEVGESSKYGIASDILDAIPSDKDVSELIDGIHGVYYDDNEQTSDKEVYLYNGDVLTGYVYEKNESSSEESTLFYKKGARFYQDYDEVEEDDAWSVRTTSEDAYKEGVSGLSEPISEAATLAKEELTDYDVERGANTYTLVINGDEYSYTYITDWDYNLVGYSYESETKVCSVTSISEQEAKEVTDKYLDEEFGVYLTPGDAMRGQKENTNYYSYFAYQPAIGTYSVKWGEYNAALKAAENGDSTALDALNATLSIEGIGFWYQDTMYYTDDAVLIVHSPEIYSNIGSGVDLSTFEVLVNENGQVKDYTSDDGYTWYTESVRDGSWKDYYYYLGTGYDLGVDDGLIYSRYSTSRADDSSYSIWDCNPEYAGDYFKVMGGDALSMLSKEDIDEYAEEVNFYNTYFYQFHLSFQYFTTSFYLEKIIWFDEELTDNTDIYKEFINFDCYFGRFGGVDIQSDLEMAIYNKYANDESYDDDYYSFNF